jgi:hypothetical protein
MFQDVKLSIDVDVWVPFPKTWENFSQVSGHTDSKYVFARCQVNSCGLCLKFFKGRN